MEYKRLGDYIREVNLRNRDLKVTRLLGVGLEKKFFPSIANIIGTDLSNYKVIRKGQFGCKFMSVGRDGILPVSLLDDDEPAIISSAYYAFEVNDPNELLPEYLMMWLRRPEFDRELWFYSGGDVRGGVNYEAFCDMPIIVPAIARQREIVSEYETLSNRIRLNEQMIAKLEETAQALYRKMFMDGIDKEHLPEGWRRGTLKEVATLKAGGDRPNEFSEEKTEIYNIPVYANGIENKGIFGYTTKPIIKVKSITISARGTIGYCFLRKQPYVPIVRLIVVIPHDEIATQYLYHYLDASNIKGSGSVQSQLTVPDMEVKEIIVPSHRLVQEFNDKVEVIDEAIEIREKENSKLTELQSLLLARMGK
ncbi:MAG: restriction endonuclease subunit S [Bacteroidales bacterium]|nr:restriction endonuclease subunit S [Bacteroidales bacterium]